MAFSVRGKAEVPEVTGHPPEETHVEPRLGSLVGPGEELTQKIDEGLRAKVVRFENRALAPPASWERTQTAELPPKAERPRLTARKRVQVEEEPQWYSSLRRLTLGGC